MGRREYYIFLGLYLVIISPKSSAKLKVGPTKPNEFRV